MAYELTPTAEMPGGDSAPKPSVVLGVIGNDTHIVACRVMAVGLSELGFTPINLETNNLPSDFADAARETNAVAVLVSSLNGEADHWCRDFRRHFARRGLPNILLYIGGNLSIGDRDAKIVDQRFHAHGFDRVFHRAHGFADALNALVVDVQNLRNRMTGERP